MDEGKPFDYVRPLATIEPTAIRFGLPVNASIGVSDPTGLQTELQRPEYHNALVIAAWEHKTSKRSYRISFQQTVAIKQRFRIGMETTSIGFSPPPFLGPEMRRMRRLRANIRILDGQPDTCPQK
jgi:hypothetical protein